MTQPEADKEPAKMAAKDEGESIGLREPTLISESGGQRCPIADLALEVAQKSASLKASLPQGVASALADLVRSMDSCDYSNLIEGHDMHPIDVEIRRY